ncbi:MAG: DnaD domain protein [Chloroflexi bacterium]|nr:DnaD domain protein [Chloroflexota bacterium]
MSDAAFSGFPGIARGTVVPNLFFTAVLPGMSAPGDVLAFLWVSRLAQDQRGEVRYVSLRQLWAHDGCAASFEALGGGRDGFERGLARCLELGAILGLQLVGAAGEETVFFVNNPASRRAVARARAGELQLQPETAVKALPVTARPGIFRLYEEHIGTITPMVGERLLEAAELYSLDWIEDAFREAAELNKRSWRYVERILQNWAQEGRANETPGRDSFEEQKQRFLGGSLGQFVRHR